MGAWKRQFSGVAAIAIGLYAHDARADQPDTCVSAFENAQNERMSGKLVSARARLPACLASSCPDRVRDDCARMRDELDRATPTATFAVRGPDGVDLDATLTVDGAPVDLQAGRSQLFDPGMHVVTWTVAGEAPRTSRVTIYEGEKSRLVVLQHAPILAPTPAPEPKRSLVAPLILGGAGVLLAATSIFFVTRASDASYRGAALAQKVPQGVQACQDSAYGPANADFCQADKDHRFATGAAWATGAAAVSAIGAAVFLYVIDKPNRRTALSF